MFSWHRTNGGPMRNSSGNIKTLIAALMFAVGCSATAMAQAPLPVPQQAPAYPLPELERVTSPISLYPDPLLAQVLAAATYADQIPEAARWADQHHYLTGPALTGAMAADQVPWDPSVQALVP